MCVCVCVYCAMMQKKKKKVYFLLWIGSKKFEIHCPIEKVSYLQLDHFRSLPIFSRECPTKTSISVSQSQEARQHYSPTENSYIYIPEVTYIVNKTKRQKWYP